MRIIAGRFKGVRLPSPRNKGVRPTTDRVREALFSALGDAVEDSRVLDLFAGTGAFGFEALSRGAASVVFVDKDRLVTKLLSQTAGSLNVQDRVVVLTLTASQAIAKLADHGRKFGIVFLDPPYETDWIQRVVSTPAFLELLEPETFLILERSMLWEEPRIPESFHKAFGRKYGDTMVEFLRLA
jgi:16S rRNA (guanine966-N2)-methyltransferase